MCYFSDAFLEGLKTKSDNFQNKFFGIIDDVCSYFGEEEEQRDFQQYIESNHSFAKPGNILYSGKKYFGGNPSAEELKKRSTIIYCGYLILLNRRRLWLRFHTSSYAYRHPKVRLVMTICSLWTSCCLLKECVEDVYRWRLPPS